MKQISETVATKAALLAIDHMRKEKGAWLVWSIDTEGFMMAPSGSQRANAIEKHWGDQVVGTFTASISSRILAWNMNLAAKEAHVPHHRTPEQILVHRDYNREYKRQQRAERRAA